MPKESAVFSKEKERNKKRYEKEIKGRRSNFINDTFSIFIENGMHVTGTELASKARWKRWITSIKEIKDSNNKPRYKFFKTTVGATKQNLFIFW